MVRGAYSIRTTFSQFGARCLVKHERFVNLPLRMEARGQPNRSVFRREGSLLGAQYQIGLVSRGRDGPWQVTRALKRKEPKQGLVVVRRF